MHICIKVINNCKNTCLSAFLPITGCCERFPRLTGNERSSIEYTTSGLNHMVVCRFNSKIYNTHACYHVTHRRPNNKQYNII